VPRSPATQYLRFTISSNPFRLPSVCRSGLWWMFIALSSELSLFAFRGVGSTSA
jgi:hypothetical protein